MRDKYVAACKNCAHIRVTVLHSVVGGKITRLRCTEHPDVFKGIPSEYYEDEKGRIRVFPNIHTCGSRTEKIKLRADANIIEKCTLSIKAGILSILCTNRAFDTAITNLSNDKYRSIQTQIETAVKSCLKECIDE